MRGKMLLLLILMASCLAGLGQKAEQENKVPTPEDLRGITARGKMIAEYDVAAWHATDVVQDMKPEQGAFRYYIAKKTDAGWIVVFGKLDEARDKFLIVYQATQGTRPEYFTAKRYDAPRENSDFFLAAARAFDLALRDLGPVNRPYNTYAIPAENGQLYVYVLPAQTKDGIYPLGGDVRYRFSADGTAMIEKRRMHKSISEIDYNDASAGIKKTEAGMHTHVLSLTPEDSDVFHVLTRRPAIPEYVGTLDGKIYVVQADGTILLGK
ncbi:MAG TPA: hypothetical protein VE866_12550 [Candidatus Binatia bacterium]|nr:hypothetical protein [Candidatus Binatia bacterium]